MSSARKRAAIHKANAEADHLRQRLMLAEHHGSQMKILAEVFAQKHDALHAALNALISGDVGRQTLAKLAGGQGTDTDDGRAWMHAAELVTPNKTANAPASTGD